LPAITLQKRPKLLHSYNQDKRGVLRGCPDSGICRKLM